jgi:hypothetical protein
VANGCEVNTQTSGTHCGACGNNCGALPNVNSTSCSGGTCVINSCDAGFANCDGLVANGCEVNTQTSGTHCGACGNNCGALPNVNSTSCASGSCVINSCDAGYADCDGVVSNGCETNLATTLGNCGSCGNNCGALPNVNSTSCTSGSCVINTCDPGYDDCDGVVANGCEVNTQTSSTNCGSCGTACGALPNVNSTSCSGGGCVINSCDLGYVDCDGLVANGCEVNTQTSNTDCGSCGNNCGALANVATTNCSGGGCVIVTCDPGYDDCDGIVANGCEVNLNTSTGDCGSCGTDCGALPNVNVTSCSAGGCVIVTCDPGYADCDGIVGNGCEINIQTNTSNCGVCGTDCGALPNVNSTSCSGGSCVINTCDPGFADCDGVVGNGCEVNTQTNTGNCGVCGNNCGALPNVNSTSCSVGACVVNTCDSGYGDCDGTASTGCEVNTQTNNENCGGCGNNCSALPNVFSTSCSVGACVINSCDPNYYDVGGGSGDGCECLANPLPLTDGAACSSAINVGTLSDAAGDSVSVTGNTPFAGRSVWYVFSAIDDVDTVGDEFHVDARFLANPLSTYRMDVYRGGCPGVGTQVADTEASSFDWYTDFNRTTTGCTIFSPCGEGNCRSTNQFGYNICNSDTAAFYVRVYEASSSAECSPYQLEMSNGVY